MNKILEKTTLRPHHLETILGMLIMKELRPALINGLYNNDQKEHAKELIQSYDNNTLKYIQIKPLEDEICNLCQEEKKIIKCNNNEQKTVLEGQTLEFKQYKIIELVQIFNKENFYKKLMSETQIY